MCGLFVTATATVTAAAAAAVPTTTTAAATSTATTAAAAATAATATYSCADNPNKYTDSTKGCNVRFYEDCCSTYSSCPVRGFSSTYHNTCWSSASITEGGTIIRVCPLWIDYSTSVQHGSTQKVIDCCFVVACGWCFCLCVCASGNWLSWERCFTVSEFVHKDAGMVLQIGFYLLPVLIIPSFDAL